MTSPHRTFRALAVLAGALAAAGCTPPPSRSLPPDQRTGAAGIRAADPRTCASRPAVRGGPVTICDQRGP